ncbi:MAG: hypothetical protein IKQ49_02185 [Eubacterium sp.]|nr:hypothetical protein [Eubacterium sp.]
MRINVSLQKACAEFEINGEQKTVDDFIALKKVMRFHDAYRKIILLHAILNSCDMKVESIIIYIDDEDPVIVKKGYNDVTEKYFPLMFSMIGKDNLRLQGWKRNEEEWKNLTSSIISKTKSEEYGAYDARQPRGKD